MKSNGEVERIDKVSRPLGKLQIQIVEAENLIAMDMHLSGSSDPYVDVHLEGSYYRTAAVQSCNPQWQSAGAELPFTSFDSLLHIVLFDSDVVFQNDDYLGEACCCLMGPHPLGRLLAGTPP